MKPRRGGKISVSETERERGRETKACITTCFMALLKHCTVSTSPGMANTDSIHRGQRGLDWEQTEPQLSDNSCAAKLRKTIFNVKALPKLKITSRNHIKMQQSTYRPLGLLRQAAHGVFLSTSRMFAAPSVPKWFSLTSCLKGSPATGSRSRLSGSTEGSRSHFTVRNGFPMGNSRHVPI